MIHITTGNKQYPTLLSKIHDPPRQLFIESSNWEHLLSMPTLAVVGSRKASAYGRAVTQQLVRGAAARGIVIVSGLALGIDSIAHQAALDAGGYTIAVLPGGLDNIYPSSHYGLAKQIIAHKGALISEYPPKTEAGIKGFYIARNRIIAGLASAVLITEAAERSGSLHTANFALEQGRDVLAVPGPITSDLSAGCNNLIKTGATPITSVDDLLEVFHMQASTGANHEVIAQNPAEHTILTLLQQGIADTESLQIESQLNPIEFQQTLSMLEITGRITSVGGGKWTLRF